jgi:23S rRNA (cytosine1962-C5)-methyltransferase
MTALQELLGSALQRRAALLQTLHSESTDCYRLFHGATEGLEGFSVDRYGDILLVQTWREPLATETLSQISEVYAEGLSPTLRLVWNHRAKNADLPYEHYHSQPTTPTESGRELGLTYDVRARHRGRDPLLFLDFRAARRRLMDVAQGKTVLNLFAYTCGIGCCAARAGATNVLNVDFSSSALQVGEQNARANNIPSECFQTLKEDVFPVVRQLAGLPVGGRRNRRPKHVKLPKRQFDICILDPPRWSTGKFGAVDVVNDYPSMFKPALLATTPGGRMLVSNNVASVPYEQWTGVLTRAAEKAGRPLEAIERIMPEADFPSPDKSPPLKLAWLTV